MNNTQKFDLIMWGMIFSTVLVLVTLMIVAKNMDLLKGYYCDKYIVPDNAPTYCSHYSKLK